MDHFDREDAWSIELPDLDLPLNDLPEDTIRADSPVLPLEFGISIPRRKSLRRSSMRNRDAIYISPGVLHIASVASPFGYEKSAFELPSPPLSPVTEKKLGRRQRLTSFISKFTTSPVPEDVSFPPIPSHTDDFSDQLSIPFDLCSDPDPFAADPLLILPRRPGSKRYSFDSTIVPSRPPSLLTTASFASTLSMANSSTSTLAPITPPTSTLPSPELSTKKLPALKRLSFNPLRSMVSLPSLQQPASPTTKRSKRNSFGTALVSNKPKKRKLVISSVPDGTSSLDAIRLWAEAFGDLRSIARQENGDLCIDFKSSSVADTVCRLQAKVYIQGIGSVGIGWRV